MHVATLDKSARIVTSTECLRPYNPIRREHMPRLMQPRAGPLARSWDLAKRGPASIARVATESRQFRPEYSGVSGVGIGAGFRDQRYFVSVERLE